MKRIMDLAKTVSRLRSEDRTLWHNFFEVMETQGEMCIPKSFRKKTLRYFGRQQETENAVCERVQKQNILRIRNKWSGEEALFNELRADRPGMRPDPRELTRVNEVVKKAKQKGCDFCNPLRYTSKDVFGRIQRTFIDEQGVKRTVWTGSNVAKYDAWSGMVYFWHHHPLEFTRAEMDAVIDAGFEWFSRVQTRDCEAKYPFFLWNCLTKAGASQVHPHAQVLIARSQPYGKVRTLFQTITRYEEHSSSWFIKTRRYLDDLYLTHKIIGLGQDVSSGDDDPVHLLVSITPVKEKETLIIAEKSPASSESARHAIFSTVRCLVDDLGVTSFNVAILMPQIEISGKIPFCLIRIVDRGSLSKATSDIGGMELYGTTVVATDPYIVARKLSKRL
jgi:hypothetical protein